MMNRSIKTTLKKTASADTSEIKANVKSFLENRKNVNKLLFVVANLENDKETHVSAAVCGLHKVFSNIIQLNEMTHTKYAKDLDEAKLTSEEQYKLWLQETYQDVVNRFLQLMHHRCPNIQELCLCSLMKLVSMEGAHPVSDILRGQSTFPAALYKRILNSLLSTDNVMNDLIMRAQEFMEYDDIRTVTMSHLMNVMKGKSGKLSEVLLKNIFSLLQILSMPDDSPERTLKLLVPSAMNVAKDLKLQRRQYGNVWNEFLKNELSINQYKRVLLLLNDKVMAHMANPVSLCDFFTHAYNIGGAISLLALNGLFVLVQKYHLNYPEFYAKLYALLDENVLHVKYRARFFYLTDLFLTSSHLPAYLVAAFIKRLASISLSAPTDSLMFVLPLINNLMIRFPNTQKLIHATEAKDIEYDPFVANVPDPAKCEALISSLWELKSLQMHYHPDVANHARKMNKNLPEREYDISERLETKYIQLLSKDLDKPIEKIHKAFTPVSGLFKSTEDKCGQFWSME